VAYLLFFKGSAKALLKYISRGKKKKYTHKLQAFSEGKKTEEAITGNHRREENPKHREQTQRKTLLL
jgi:hypothetical protein